ncbi:nif-specific transcriptional activator NifA [Methylophilus sp. YYY-1]|uniref:nif-specific transcriptional activator NifA n=1 Tax=Methylophilus sp. YYY-1 TaxID=2682087 RepID=UPI0023B2E263|nr:nif-specific transcriptional activator NifA [Methylophilus sp. YYY-1]
MMANLSDSSHVALVTIYEIGKILSSSLDLQKTLRQVVNLVANHLGMQRGMVYVRDDGDSLQVLASVGFSKEEVARARFKVGEGVTGRICQMGMPAVIPDLVQEPLFLNRTGAHRSVEGMTVAYLGVPIKTGRETIGVLSFERFAEDKHGLFEEDLQLLTMVANLIGQTILLNQQVTSDREQLMQERQRLQKELAGKYSIGNVVGQSKRMREVFADVHMAAPGNSTILLRGESGTGKEVIARSIHFLSSRKDKPFIKVNCAALSESLLESELFGHEKGAFTGAMQERKGRFEQAHGGTLFLDEIGDTSAAFQVKLLRVLQERELERVGGNKTIKVDVRLICATNRNLEEAVNKGEFRSDLYFRINVISISLPALRERRDDIPLLVENFLGKFNKENSARVSITPEAMNVLSNCHWPGNVRELENCVERFATMARSNLIREVDIPCQTNHCLSSTLWKYQAQGTVIPIAPVNVSPASPPPPVELPPQEVAEEMPLTEREQLVQAMEKSGWVQAKAARLLNLTPRQMGYALKKYNIEVKRF